MATPKYDPNDHLPFGAAIEPSLARVIASNNLRRKEAYTYWRKLLIENGETDFFATQDSDVFKLARACPNKPISSLLPNRTHLVPPDAKELIGKSGCLVSGEEIAANIDSKTTYEQLLVDLATFKASTLSDTPAKDYKSISRGIMASREIYDSARRLTLARRVALEFDVPLPEVFALFRQETALALTPSGDSYSFAPLIKTSPNTCRPPAVSLYPPNTEEDPYRCDRTGFNLAHAFKPNEQILTSEAGRDFHMALFNLLVVGGLDSMVNPHLTDQDELKQLLQMTSSAPSLALLNAKLQGRRNGLETEEQKQDFDNMLLGLWMGVIEASNPLHRASDLFREASNTLISLLANHRAVFHPLKPKLLYLVGNRSSEDTYQCTRVQLRWYSSRRSPLTLLARQDRSARFQLMPRLSPFLSYLRYNMGDALFVGTLMRFLNNIDEVLQEWTNNRSNWGKDMDLLSVYQETGWTPDAGDKKQLDQFAKSWKTGPHTDDAWRHVGLINSFQNANRESWIKNGTSSAKFKKFAQYVRDFLSFINDRRLLPLLLVGLEYTPSSTVEKLGIPGSGGSALVKAHSFERLRLIYEKAMNDAGVNK